MKRLTDLYTYRNQDDYICSEYFCVEELNRPEHECYFECLQKLGPIEDIEEGLGISVWVFFTALGNGIYILNNGSPYSESSVDLVFECRNNYKSPVGFKGGVSDHTVYFRDYGQTWTLRPELMEDYL